MFWARLSTKFFAGASFAAATFLRLAAELVALHTITLAHVTHNDCSLQGMKLQKVMKYVKQMNLREREERGICKSLRWKVRRCTGYDCLVFLLQRLQYFQGETSSKYNGYWSAYWKGRRWVLFPVSNHSFVIFY